MTPSGWVLSSGIFLTCLLGSDRFQSDSWRAACVAPSFMYSCSPPWRDVIMTCLSCRDRLLRCPDYGAGLERLRLRLLGNEYRWAGCPAALSSLCEGGSSGDFKRLLRNHTWLWLIKRMDALVRLFFSFQCSANELWVTERGNTTTSGAGREC